MKEFETTDIVELKSDANLYYVTGVIHDDFRLFVRRENEEEKEIDFDEVQQQWELKK